MKKLKRVLSYCLSLLILVSAVSIVSERKVNAAVDFSAMPVPIIDTTGVGSNIARTMRLLETSTAQKPNTVRIAITGQSISDTYGNTWCLDLINWLKSQYPSANIEYKNFAIGGFASDPLYKRVPDDIRSFYPDLILLYVYGGEPDYEKILQSMRRETQADIMMQTCHYNSADSWNDSLSFEVLPRLAERYGAELCEIRKPWKKFLDDNHLSPSVLLKDDVHLNEDGQTMMLGLMKQFFVTRAINDNDPIFAKEVEITSSMWVDGKLTVPFDGNRVEVVAGSGTQYPASVAIDGAKPSQYPLAYNRTLESGGMYGTKLGIIHYNGIAGNQNWTIEITKSASNSIEYTLAGSKSTEKKYSSNGVIQGNDISLDKDSFILNFGSPAVGSKMFFTTYLNGTDTYMGQTNVLISGIVPKKSYTLTLTAKNAGQIPDIKKLVFYDPDTRKQPGYTKPNANPLPEQPVPTRQPEPTPIPGSEPAPTLPVNNHSFENNLTGWNSFFGTTKIVNPIDEPESFAAFSGDKVLKIPKSDAGLTQSVTLSPNVQYKLTYYRYGGCQENKGVEVMLSSQAYDQAPYAYSDKTWKPLSFRETGLGDGWIKCEKVYPAIVEGFNYMISIRGWGGEDKRLDTYLDNITISTPGAIYKNDLSANEIDFPVTGWTTDAGGTAFLVKNDGTQPYLDINSKNNPQYIPLNGLTPGKKYRIIANVKNAQADTSGNNQGNDLSFELQAAAWERTSDPENPNIVYKSTSNAPKLTVKTGTIAQNAGYAEYSGEGIAMSPAKSLPEGYDQYRLKILLSGDKDTTVQMASIKIQELFDEPANVDPGQDKPTPTPTPTPTATPTLTPTPIPGTPTPSPTQAKVKSLKLSSTKITLGLGKSKTLRVTISPDNAVNKNLNWVSSRNNIATVNGSGKITAKKTGTATITVTSDNGVKASCKVTVVRYAKSIKLSKTSLSLTRGRTIKLKVKFNPASTTAKAVKWSTSNNKIVTVTQKGSVKGIKKGNAVIKAKSINGKVSKCKVKVK